jgi:hypothetical protein
MQTEPQIVATSTVSQNILGWAVMVVSDALVLFCWYLAITDTDHFFSVRGSWALPGVTLLFAIVSYKILKTSWRAMSNGGRILWIENERLIYLDPSVLSVRCDDIVSVSPTRSNGFSAISLSLRDGRQETLPGRNMNIPRDQIMRRLREICGLPEPAPESEQKA